MKARYALLGLAGALAGVVGALAYESRQLNRPATGNPEEFVRRGKSAIGQRVVVCLGASIVHGRISVDFVEALRQRYPEREYAFVNAGVNGDLAYNALRRLDSVIACNPDAVVVLVGTNDATSTLYPSIRQLAMRSKHLPQEPSLAWYRENIEAIVTRLEQRTHARIGLCSLPVLGEDVSSPADCRIQELNTIVREVAEQHGIAYLPVHERQAEYLAARHADHGRPYTGAPALMMAAGVQHTLLGQSLDDISRRNGLALTVELMHMNGEGAKIIADTVQAFLAGAAA